ncbi:hypothetical protein LPJ57_002467 [Coemansia sp. RSA 486]|nr:hypothetical protein LPJ57_002467 [Coemansia sp. RSA 486]KAJ2237391.1 hypothetical protein IWW45_001000 [Coemansia sp. RSA 485]
MRTPQLLLLASTLVTAFPANQQVNVDGLAAVLSQIASRTLPLAGGGLASGQLRAEQSYIQNSQSSAGETSSADTDGEAPSPEAEAIDGVDGYDRHKHKGHKGHKDKCEEKEEPKCHEKGEEHKCGCCAKATPTYHINIDCDDGRYKTISLPAQGCPYVYGDDVRHSLAPLVDHDCCQRYCYAPCQQPTCGMYGSCPPQRLCCPPCDPCGHHLEACCPQPPPPQPCCPPPPFIYDECCDHEEKKHKKIHKKKKCKKGAEGGYQGRYADVNNNNNNENNNVNGNPREEDEDN